MTAVTAASPALRAVRDAGQSVWVDALSRELLRSGELDRLRDLGVRGLTSNPSIFQAAIAGSDAYDEQLAALRGAGASAAEALDALMVADVQGACDVFAPVHAASGGQDGWVSLEVDPRLARSAPESVAAARRLAGAVDRPNLMIKLPATPEGLVAMEELLALGQSVNATLVFDARTALAAAGAHARAAARRPAGTPAPRSVVSVFVSRIDTAVDPRVGEPLRGRAAIANAHAILAAWDACAAGEAEVRRTQRLLWASTGVKDERPPLAYVAPLVARGTVTTLPPTTLQALIEAAPAELARPHGAHPAPGTLHALAAAGVDLPTVAAELRRRGVEQFLAAHLGLLELVGARV